MNKFRSSIFIAFLLALMSAMPASAQSEPVILTIDGAIEGGEPIDFTRADLMAMGATAITTSTPWNEGTPTFEGVLMSRLMEEIGATGSIAEILALNNYRTSIPVSDFSEFPVILAWQMDGEALTVRNKGPLFVIYPFDDSADLSTDVYYARAAWQVRSITITN